MRGMRRGAVVLLWSVAVLATGCASVTPISGRSELALEQPRALASSRRSESGPVSPRGRAVAEGDGRERATQTRQAVLDTVAAVRGSTRDVASALTRLAARPPGLGNRGLSGVNGVFTRYLDGGSRQLPWLHQALGGVTRLAEMAEEVSDVDMELGILRMTGSRLQAAMFGSMLLAAWLDFLQLADAVLRECPAYGVETLFVDMNRVQQRMEPTLAALASQDPARVEAAATAMPELMGQLTREFGSIRDGAQLAMERSGKTLAFAQLVEMLTLVSTLKMSLPRLPPAAPATVGVGLVMGSGGVMVGSRLVVSAEWVEMVRRLVKAGVISIPAVSAAVRIHAGQVMMAQANGDLPKGVREALGDSPEVRGMHETGKAGAGMSEDPLHHVMPQERRAWFEQRGFQGDMDIDNFCVRLERAHHEAIHGGGDWRLGRIWPNEWNRMIMRVLSKAESEAGRLLTRNEILKIVAKNMRDYDIPMTFTPGRNR
jgi:hypothetical protein